MSTIAFRGRVMAADTARHHYEANLLLPQSKFSKIVRLSDGSLIAGCGPKRQIMGFAQWCEHQLWLDAKAKEDKEDFPNLSSLHPGLRHARNYYDSRSPHINEDMILWLSVDGRAVVFDGKSDVWDVSDCEFYAIGTGAAVALGALNMGASPEQAVRIAMIYDPLTGGDVQVEAVG